MNVYHIKCEYGNEKSLINFINSVSFEFSDSLTIHYDGGSSSVLTRKLFAVLWLNGGFHLSAGR